MSILLQPFDEAERDVIRDCLSGLAGVDFFKRYADIRLGQLVARFDSIDKSAMQGEIEKITALRMELLYLANESASIAKDGQDSRNQETLNETSVLDD